MDVHKALRELYEEKKRLDAAITSLERRLRLQVRPRPVVARGRKQMSADERAEVSRRMKQYWEARRTQARALVAVSNSAVRKIASGA